MTNSTSKPDEFRIAIKEARLIEGVERHDPKAAQWLREEQFERFERHYNIHQLYLSNWFSWILTPQGYDYWEAIHLAMHEEGFYDELNK